MLVSHDPRPISKTNIVKICVRYISTRFLIIRFHISGEYCLEKSFLCPLKSCAKRSWTYITLCERYTPEFWYSFQSNGYQNPFLSGEYL
jgi:hypothetical protein